MPDVSWLCLFWILISLCRGWQKKAKLCVCWWPASTMKKRNDICMFYVFPVTQSVIFPLLLPCRRTYSLKSKYTSILYSLRWSVDSDQPQVPCLAENYSDDCYAFRLCLTQENSTLRYLPANHSCLGFIHQLTDP